MTIDRTAFADEYPFESHFAEIDGHQYHYVDEGEGDVLLFVHGNPSWSFAWRNLIKEFSKTHRCIAVDHIGCGMSDKPQDYPYRLENHISNLRSLVEALDLQNITLLAHDWGGAIGMGTAGRMADRFSRFVLFNTAAFRSKAIPLRIAVCRIPIFGELAIQGCNGFAGAAVHMAVEKKMSAAIKAGYLAPYDSWANRIATHRFVKDIPLKESHPSYQTLVGVEEGLAQFVEHPMLLIWGAKDWCFTTDFLKEFQQRFPKAESDVYKDASHYVFEDADDRIRERLKSFMTK
ncbi:MAG: alpha/beta fold hydrolase [Planctomycetaceae bacterium]